ncbi:MAG: NTP transferase domain-containing protein [Armatimonadetes bacterium]|nr:NTP transferase domain-containing protein [Armatimonadota bacterium]
MIPCADLGTRMLPLTRRVPKELLPYGDRTLIDHALRELAEAGIQQVGLVIRRDKISLREHLEGTDAFGQASPTPPGMRLTFLEQPQPDGLAGALACACGSVEADHFLLLFPDQLLLQGNASRLLLEHFDGQDSLSALVRIPRAEQHYFPGASGFELEGEGPRYRVAGLLGERDSPRLSDEHHTVRGFGRTIYRRDFLQQVRDRGFGPAFLAQLPHGRHHAVVLDGRPIDVGTLGGYQHFWSLWEPVRTEAPV